MSESEASPVRPTFRPLPGSGSSEVGILVLRDGARHRVWRALPEDVRRVRSLFARLSVEEVGEVARSLRLDPDGVTGFVEALNREGTGEALLVEDPEAGEEIVAFGAYRLLEDGRAALTLAVRPSHRGRGIGRLLLDRLAVLAAHRGVERLSGTASLRPLFHPRAVAVAGASRDPGSVGHRILQGLLRGGFEGTVYPVNPAADQVASMEAHPSVAAIDGPVDLAVVAVPAPVVPQVVESCGEAGVRGLVVVTAGYAETGGEGRSRQRALTDRVRELGMRMVGPNCLGLLHTHPEVRLNASFAPLMPPEGSVALCSQSGALGIAIIALARRVNLGLSAFVSVGNKADVAADDLLEYWDEDARTDVLLFYLESFERSRRFARIARRVGKRKPIVVVKSGRTEAGERAAGSHTAALTGTETAVEALFRQTGIIRASTLQEMFGIARAVTEQPLPPGRRFAVVTNAGGPAILCADALDAAGLEVEPLTDETRAALEEFLPDAAATGNPVDMIASAGPDAYRRAVETVLTAPEVDGLVVIYTPVGITDVGAVEEAVVEGVAAAREAGAVEEPVLASVVGGEEEIHLLRSGDGPSVPAFPFPEEIGRVAGKLVTYAEWRSREPGAFPDYPDQELESAREISELDLNPIFALEPGEGYRVADARIGVARRDGRRGG